MTDKSEQEAAIKELQHALAQLEKLEQKWTSLPEEVRLTLRRENPQLAEFFADVWKH